MCRAVAFIDNPATVIHMKVSIHNYEGRLTGALRTLSRARTSSRNKDLIIRFKDHCLLTGLTKARAIRYIYYLIKISQWLGTDFESASRSDIESLVSKIQASPYAEFSKKELRITVRRFYKWLRETEDYPPEVKWISTKCKTRGRIILPEDLLTKEDVKKMSDAAISERDRAFVNVIYETGSRIEEILTIRIRNLQFDHYGAKLRVNGKTGPRRCRIISSVPYLTEWLNKHPFKDDPDAFIWLSSWKKLLSYSGAFTMLRRLAARAGVKRRVNPHSFRHACATHLANHLTEAQMNEYLGWVQSSKMASIYVHLSGRDVDKALLKLHGIQTDDQLEEKDILAPKKCIRCNTSNPASNKFCSLCGLPLDEKAGTEVIKQSLTRNQADTTLDKMLEDPEFRDVFLRKAREVLQN